MKPTANASPFSVHRTFVVQFRAETDAGHGHITGRIEHVASRQTARFQSWMEMRTFMVRVLRQAQSRSAVGPDES